MLGKFYKSKRLALVSSPFGLKRGEYYWYKGNTFFEFCKHFLS